MTAIELKAQVYDLIVKRAQLQQEVQSISNAIDQKAAEITKIEAKEIEQTK